MREIGSVKVSISNVQYKLNTNAVFTVHIILDYSAELLFKVQKSRDTYS